MSGETWHCPRIDDEAEDRADLRRDRCSGATRAPARGGVAGIWLEARMPGMAAAQVLAAPRGGADRPACPVVATVAADICLVEPLLALRPGLIEAGLAAGFLRRPTKPIRIPAFMQAPDQAPELANQPTARRAVEETP